MQHHHRTRVRPVDSALPFDNPPPAPAAAPAGSASSGVTGGQVFRSSLLRAIYQLKELRANAARKNSSPCYPAMASPRTGTPGPSGHGERRDGGQVDPVHLLQIARDLLTDKSIVPNAECQRVLEDVLVLTESCIYTTPGDLGTGLNDSGGARKNNPTSSTPGDGGAGLNDSDRSGSSGGTKSSGGSETERSSRNQQHASGAGVFAKYVSAQ